MDLGQLINTRGIIRLDTGNKMDALEKLIEGLAKRKEVTSKQKLRRAIKDREKILSTGIGFGIAVPHAKLAEVKEFCAVIGLSKAGIPFESMDGKPVQVIVMIAAPEERHDDYLRILDKITKTLRDDEFKKRLLETKDTKSAIALLTQV